jgi:hypothetical protein
MLPRHSRKAGIDRNRERVRLWKVQGKEAGGEIKVRSSDARMNE